MKKLKRILNFLFRFFVRISHVLEHLICDEVPHIDEEEKDG